MKNAISMWRLIPNRSLSVWIALYGLLTLGFVQETFAANYFNWGVESLRPNYGANPAPYDVQWHDSSASRRDCTVSRSGSCSMRLTVIGNDGGNQGLGADLVEGPPTYPFNMVGGPAVYYRWWMRVMPGFGWGTNQRKTKSSRVTTAGGHGGYTGYVGGSGFWLGEAEQGAPGQDPVMSISYTIPADGVWHEYVVMVKPNTTTSASNAQFKAWVDGVVVGDKTNFRLSQDTGRMRESWGGWMVSPYFQLNSSSAGGTMYLDDFSTDDTFNSTITLGGISAPTNLQVQ